MPNKIDRTGEKGISNRGQEMEIIRYRNFGDIDVKFDDGTIVYHKQYQDFLHGKIMNPNNKHAIKRYEEKYVGKSTKANNGLMMKIIGYRCARDIDIEFEDGTIIEHVDYASFKRGSVKHPKIKTKRPKPTNRDLVLGQTSIATNGQKMTIIEYRNVRDMDVQFEDGTIKSGVYYGAFKCGRVANPNFKVVKRKSNAEKYLGKTYTTNSGYTIKVVEYRNNTHVDVEFEDGTVVKNLCMSAIKKGQVRKR